MGKEEGKKEGAEMLAERQEQNKSVKPSPTDRVLAKHLMEGSTRGEAMLAAGFLPSVAKSKTKRCDAPGVQTALAEALEKAGGSKSRIADVLVAGLDATKVISAVVIASDGEGMKDAGSMTKDFVEIPDFQERRKAAMDISELAGWKPKGQLEVSAGESYHERIARLAREANGEPDPDEDVIEVESDDLGPVEEKTNA